MVLRANKKINSFQDLDQVEAYILYNHKFISTKPKLARPCLLVEQGNSRANCKVKDCGQALTGCEVSMLDSVYNVQLFTHLRPDAITNTLVSIHGPCVAARTRCKLYINFSDARSCEIMLLRLHHKTSSWQLCNPGKFRELVVKVVSELLTLSVIIQLPHVSFI